jgi:calcineurin-like phosphoesterase family protein
MTQTFFTSDLHFSHKTVAKLRGFTEPPVKCDEPEHFNPCNLCAPGDTVAHDAAVIANWNSVVRPEDFVWVLGDVGMGHVERFADSLIRLNGRLHLITGNHDDPWPGNRDSFKFQRNWLDYFESVQAFARRRVDGKVVLLSHFPYDGDHTDDPRATQFRLRDEGEILLHGHLHTKNKITPLPVTECFFCSALLNDGPCNHNDQVVSRQIHVGLDAWDLKPVPMQAIQELITALPEGGKSDCTTADAS